MIAIKCPWEIKEKKKNNNEDIEYIEKEELILYIDIYIDLDIEKEKKKWFPTSYMPDT